MVHFDMLDVVVFYCVFINSTRIHMNSCKIHINSCRILVNSYKFIWIYRNLEEFIWIHMNFVFGNRDLGATWHVLYRPNTHIKMTSQKFLKKMRLCANYSNILVNSYKFLQEFLSECPPIRHEIFRCVMTLKPLFLSSAYRKNFSTVFMLIHARLTSKRMFYDVLHSDITGNRLNAISSWYNPYHIEKYFLFTFFLKIF